MPFFHLIETILILVNFAILLFFVIKRFSSCNNCEKVLETLDANMNLLNLIYEKQKKDNVRKMVETYTQVQTLLKLTEASTVSLFKYDYSKNNSIILHFVFSFNKNGEISHDSYLDKLPVTSNSLNLEILMDNDRLGVMMVSDLKVHDIILYNLLIYRNLEKIYFKNIVKENVPVGYISFFYDNDYIMSERQIEETLRILNKISTLL